MPLPFRRAAESPCSRSTEAPQRFLPASRTRAQRWRPPLWARLAGALALVAVASEPGSGRCAWAAAGGGAPGTMEPTWPPGLVVPASPADGPPAAGSLPGAGRVSPTGEYEYSLPLEVPVGTQIRSAMDQAKGIRFNLDGVDLSRVSGALNEFGEPTAGYTNYELHLLLSTPQYLGKATFYRGGAAVPSPF